MAIVNSVRGKTPVWGDDCFLAENSVLVGDIVMGNHCSIWFSAVLRGDVNSIVIGNYSNIQDGVVVHGTYEKAKTTIGNYVSVGHNAILHGCTIEDEVLVGMGAIVMDNAIIERGALVAAGSIVLENTIVRAGELYAGNPAKKIKNLTDEVKKSVLNTTKNYLMYADWYKNKDE
ncbi:gamma carbonic anhydrase family protein [Bacteriovoracaceae bacterium]|nr:gamma carbonic anhydrase family protein [Bacteriovoracaceae bacterium]